jgi:hypothetical protein
VRAIANVVCDAKRGHPDLPHLARAGILAEGRKAVGSTYECDGELTVLASRVTSLK